MTWRGPTYRGEFPSLGWAISDWITENLWVPDGPHTGEPLVLTDEQLELLVRFYRLDPKTGAAVYRRASVVRPKGWGKSPFLAAIALAEACGPVRFRCWSEDGEAVGAPPPTPWVQIAAVSEDQTANTWRSLMGMVGLTDEDNERAPVVTRYGLDAGITRINVPGGGLIEYVTAASGTRQGQRVTFSVFDETHLWTPLNHGDRLAETIRGNVSKMDGRTFESTNAWKPGEDSVAERTCKAKDAAGVLFDHRKPTGEVNLRNRGQCRRHLREVYGDAAKKGGWVSIDRLLGDIHDPDTTEDYALRFFFNLETVGAETWIDDRVFRALGREVTPDPQEAITAGFSGRLYDGVFLWGCRMDTGELFALLTWEQVGEMAPRGEVHAAVERMMAAYTVRRFYVDLSQWATEYDTWHLAYGDTVVSRPPQQTANMADACDRFHTAVSEGTLHHDGNEILSRHVAACRTRKVAAGHLIQPRTDAPADQITAAKAAVLAWEARADVMASDPEPEPWFAFG